MRHESALFKALGDPHRLALATLLALRGETCVCHLALALGEPAFKVSRHLGILRAAGMVEARREGTWMYYRLAEARSSLEADLQHGLAASLADHAFVVDALARIERACCGTSDTDPEGGAP